MAIGRLHVITDTRTGRDPLAVATAAVEAGAPVVQVRAKDWTDRALYELTCRIRDVCVRHGATCVVNDRLHIAIAAEVDGAHIGEHDLPVATARRVLGSAAILGATAREPETACQHAADGVSYLGVGPVFASRTKAGLPAPLGTAGLARVTAATDLPVIAIAGVTAATVPDLIAAGAHGVAVVGAVSDADDPFAATEDLLRALEKAS